MSKSINIDLTVFALLVGLIALMAVFHWLPILLMGLFAFVIGLLKFYDRRNDIVALIAMIVGLVVIIVVVWWNI